MNKQDFTNTMKEGFAILQKDIFNLSTVCDNLPELPAGADYFALTGFPIPQFAHALLRISVDNREDVLPIVKLFEPCGVLYALDIEPNFRPVYSAANAEKFEQIYPLVFSGYVMMEQDADGNRYTNTVCFYANISGIMTCVIVHVRYDAARVYPDSASGLPLGRIQAESGLTNGLRSVSVFWDADLTESEWLAHYCSSQDADDWDDVIS